MSEDIRAAPLDIFTAEEAQQVRSALAESLGSTLRPGERFSASGSYHDERLEVSVELADPGRTDVATFVAGYEIGKEDGLSLVDARAHAIEFLHAMILEYLQSDRFPRPHIDWREYRFDGHTVFFRGSVVNEDLERQADALLGVSNDDT